MSDMPMPRNQLKTCGISIELRIYLGFSFLALSSCHYATQSTSSLPSTYFAARGPAPAPALVLQNHSITLHLTCSATHLAVEIPHTLLSTAIVLPMWKHPILHRSTSLLLGSVTVPQA
jgi:hypothetical protein